MTPRLKNTFIFIGAGLALYAAAGFLVARRRKEPPLETLS
jgi:LPXTG-motif cell wall-anchored protein